MKKKKSLGRKLWIAGVVVLSTIAVLLLAAFVAFRLEWRDAEFHDDPAGRAAQRFFPKQEDLPGTPEVNLEHRTTLVTEYYCFTIRYQDGDDFRTYCATLTELYPTATDKDYFPLHMDHKEFEVGNYAFRAIHLEKNVEEVQEQKASGRSRPFTPLIGYSAQTQTIVFLYLWDDNGTIWDVTYEIPDLVHPLRNENFWEETGPYA